MSPRKHPRPHRRAGDRAQRTAFAREHAAGCSSPASTTSSASRSTSARSWPASRPSAAASQDERESTPRSAPCASSWTAAIPRSTAQPLPLPRRERRILEYLASNRGRRVTKTQVFNAIYGIFDEEVEENVVESHISKLRKKLREKLGFDPIDSKRFLGYRLSSDAQLRRGAPPGNSVRASFAQVVAVILASSVAGN